MRNELDLHAPASEWPARLDSCRPFLVRPDNDPDREEVCILLEDEVLYIGRDDMAYSDLDGLHSEHTFVRYLGRGESVKIFGMGEVA